MPGADPNLAGLMQFGARAMIAAHMASAKSAKLSDFALPLVDGEIMAKSAMNAWCDLYLHISRQRLTTGPPSGCVSASGS